MGKIIIKKDKCKGCQLCVVYCPRGLISLDSKLNLKGVHPAIFNDSLVKCTACTFCALVCPEVCIEVYK